MPVHPGINHIIHYGKVNMSTTFIYVIERDYEEPVKRATLWKDSAVNRQTINESQLDLAHVKEFDGYKFVPAISGPILDDAPDLYVSYMHGMTVIDEDGEEGWEQLDSSSDAELSIFHPSYVDGEEIAHALMCAIEGWEY
mgnify:CR=1 FL=1